MYIVSPHRTRTWSPVFALAVVVVSYCPWRAAFSIVVAAQYAVIPVPDSGSPHPRRRFFLPFRPPLLSYPQCPIKVIPGPFACALIPRPPQLMQFFSALGPSAFSCPLVFFPPQLKGRQF